MEESKDVLYRMLGSQADSVNESRGEDPLGNRSEVIHDMYNRMYDPTPTEIKERLSNAELPEVGDVGYIHGFPGSTGTVTKVYDQDRSIDLKVKGGPNDGQTVTVPFKYFTKGVKIESKQRLVALPTMILPGSMMPQTVRVEDLAIGDQVKTPDGTGIIRNIYGEGVYDVAVMGEDGRLSKVAHYKPEDLEPIVQDRSLHEVDVDMPHSMTSPSLTQTAAPVNPVPHSGESTPEGMQECPIGPADTDGHSHSGYCDAQGNGYTSTDGGHNHAILNWVCQPGKEGHRHQVNKPSGDDDEKGESRQAAMEAASRDPKRPNASKMPQRGTSTAGSGHETSYRRTQKGKAGSPNTESGSTTESLLQVTLNGDHTHVASVASDTGNGMVSEGNHQHAIKGFKVAPHPNDGHSHTLSVNEGKFRKIKHGKNHRYYESQDFGEGDPMNKRQLKKRLTESETHPVREEDDQDEEIDPTQDTGVEMAASMIDHPSGLHPEDEPLDAIDNQESLEAASEKEVDEDDEMEMEDEDVDEEDFDEDVEEDDVEAATCSQGHPVQEDAAFCGTCGVKVGIDETNEADDDKDDQTMECKKCGADIPAGSKYCTKCGASQGPMGDMDDRGESLQLMRRKFESTFLKTFDRALRQLQG